VQIAIWVGLGFGDLDSHVRGTLDSEASLFILLDLLKRDMDIYDQINHKGHVTS
jgi:hypothetical protein